MTESRYKIEYVQTEPIKEKKFRFFGVLGYLWLALLASVLTYGVVYKHISTNEIISYFQKFKTGVVNTDFSDITENSTKTEAALSEESILIETEITKTEKSHNESLENTAESQKLVSEVIDNNKDEDNTNDDELPEDVVFESESIEPEPASNQTQKQETESIVNEIIKEQEKQEATSAVTPTPETIVATETIENTIVAIENEIVKTETAIQTEPVAQKVIIKEAIVDKESLSDQQTPKEKEVESTSIAKSQEIQIDAITAAIKEQAEEKAEAEEKNLDIKVKSDTTVKLETISKKEAVVAEKKSAKASLSKLVKNAISTPSENDMAYLKAVTDYEINKIANSDFLKKIKSQENKTSEKDLENIIKKPAKSETSAVDAIITAMNADKAAKEKPPLSFQEKIQSEVNLLLKTNDKVQSTSQLNN